MSKKSMRSTVLTLNSIVVVFFSCFLAYTFVAHQHLVSLARNFVAEKTLVYSKPVMGVAADAMESPMVAKFLTDEQSMAVRNEMKNYEENPETYIADLTQLPMQEVPVENTNPIVETFASMKSKIREFYDGTLNALITDLRIFSVSNLVAGLVAFGLAYRSKAEIEKPIIVSSFLTFVAVLYCSFLYLDDLTFFRLLFRTHMGWWYAVFLIVMIALLCLEQGHLVKPDDPNVTSRDRGSTDGKEGIN